MKNEYSEHQTDPLLCIFSQDFTYRSRHIETDAILSSAQPCHVHCARVRVRVCVAWGGGEQGRDWHAQSNRNSVAQIKTTMQTAV